MKKGKWKNSQGFNPLVNSMLIILLLILINILSARFYTRIDLTTEKRYTVSDATENILEDLDDLVYVKVYLEGEFPSGFIRLQNACRDLLNEFRSIAGPDFRYEFVNPLDADNPDERKEIFNELVEKGLSPTNLQVKSGEGYEEKIIFPGALIYYKGREFPVQLLENQIGYSSGEILNNSVISLEFKFISAIKKLMWHKAPHILFLDGHGELSPLEVSDFTSTLKDLRYDVSRMDLSKNYMIPDNIDLAICAKPQEAFSSKDLFKIDQFIMRGGKMLFLFETVKADMDSLRKKQMFMALNQELNLENLLFKYGVRVNFDLIQDIELYNPIPLIVGEQTQLFPWYYYPLLTSGGSHPVSNNLDPVAARFVSSMDTVRNNITKTVLLHSSRYSKAVLTPVRIHLGMLMEEPNTEMYDQSYLPAAILLEGKFESFFKNYLDESFLRVIDTSDALSFHEESDHNRMIVISDGDIIKNEIRSNGSIYPLGYYRYTEQTFANKDFLINCIEYLLDESGILQSRTKEIKLRLLDRIRIRNEKLKWQLINIVTPLFILIVFGLIFNIRRKKLYTR